MKILHYVDDNRLVWSRPWRQLLKAVGEQMEGVVQIVVCRPGGTLEQQIHEDGLGVITYTPCLSWSPHLCLHFRQILADIQPDIIHTRLSTAAAIAGLWGKKFGIPVVSTVDKYPRGKYYRRATVVVPCSHAVLKHMEGEGFVGDQMKVVINPIRIDDYRNDPVVRKQVRQSVNLDDQRIIVLAMARFVKWKGLDLLIRAASSVEIDNPWELWIVGGGPMKRELEQLATASMQDNQTVTIRLFPFAEDVRPFLWAADLFVQPSYHVPGSGGPEGFSLALLEALAAGLPAVVFDCGGAPEVVKEGVTGWLASPGDWTSLKKAMKKALSHVKDPRIRSNVRERVQHHDVEITAQEYIDVYRRVTMDDSTR